VSALAVITSLQTCDTHEVTASAVITSGAK